MDRLCPAVNAGSKHQSSFGWQIRQSVYLRCNGAFSDLSGEAIADFIILEKPRKKIGIKSYRQPTQVDRSSRPRGARESSLRNSAKQLGVILKDALPRFIGDAVNVVGLTV